MRSLIARLVTALGAAIFGIFIALFGQGVWSALIAVNFAATPTIPWAVGAMAGVLWLMWQYLNGRWWPRSTAPARRRNLRANRVPRDVMACALLAGALSLAALAGCWSVMAQVVRMPGSVLPDLSKYPPVTTALAVAMGALVSPILEQAGIWGYCQSILEREFSGPAAIALAAIVFAILPHPPTHAAIWPKLIFFFLTGVCFGAIARFCGSILPGVAVHIAGLFAFFLFVWPYDTERRLVAQAGADAWFWIHAAQAIVFTGLAILAFARLARLSQPDRSATVSGTTEARVTD
jgi:membrane protease YdiL (CAAX protease family)